MHFASCCESHSQAVTHALQHVVRYPDMSLRLADKGKFLLHLAELACCLGAHMQKKTISASTCNSDTKSCKEVPSTISETAPQKCQLGSPGQTYAVIFKFGLDLATI